MLLSGEKKSNTGENNKKTTTIYLLTKDKVLLYCMIANILPSERATEKRKGRWPFAPCFSLFAF